MKALVTQITKELRSKTDEATQGLVATQSCSHPWTESTQGRGDVPRNSSERGYLARARTMEGEPRS